MDLFVYVLQTPVKDDDDDDDDDDAPKQVIQTLVGEF